MKNLVVQDMFIQIFIQESGDEWARDKDGVICCELDAGSKELELVVVLMRQPQELSMLNLRCVSAITIRLNMPMM